MPPAKHHACFSYLFFFFFFDGCTCFPHIYGLAIFFILPQMVKPIWASASSYGMNAQGWEITNCVKNARGESQTLFSFLNLKTDRKKKQQQLHASYAKIKQIRYNTDWLCCYNHSYSCLKVFPACTFSLPEAGISDKEAPGGLQQQTAYYSIRPVFCSVDQLNLLTPQWQLSPCFSLSYPQFSFCFHFLNIFYIQTVERIQNHGRQCFGVEVGGDLGRLLELASLKVSF